MSKKGEVHRMVSDISSAIQSSALLSLLDEAKANGSLPEPAIAIRDDQASLSNVNNPRRRTKRREKTTKQRDAILPKCLADIPQSTLDERIKPIKRALERVDAEKLLNLELIHPSASSRLEGQTTLGARVQDGVYCRPISDQILPKLCVDDGEDGDDENAAMNNAHDEYRNSVVRYLHIAEIPDQYTIGIFVFGPNQRIPLHDHPEMCVLSRVLYGDLQRLSLDLDRGEQEHNRRNTSSKSMGEVDSVAMRDMEGDKRFDEPFVRSLDQDHHASSSWLSRSATWLRTSLNGRNFGSGGNSHNNDFDHHQKQFPNGTKLAFKNSIDVLQAPGVVALYPFEGNLHEFVAGPHGAAVLDVLLPPYDDECKRDCTFYHIRDVDNATSSMSTESTSPVSSSTTSVASENSCQNQSRSLTIEEQQSNEKYRGIETENTNKVMLGIEKHEQSFHTRRIPCLVVPTGQPETFHCISGRYRDIGDAEDDYDAMESDDSSEESIMEGSHFDGDNKNMLHGDIIFGDDIKE